MFGTDYLGLEMGSVWSRLGSEVQVIEFLDHITPGMDKEISNEFQKLLKKQGINFNLKTKVESISKNMIHVGTNIGDGQTVKASLQSFIGATFTAIFESLVLGSKAGIDGQTLYDVFSTSGVSSPLFKNCAKLIMDRKFENTGSHISTMYKDLGITMDMAKKNGVPMFTTGAAFELFQAGISLYPEGDNWSIVKVLEKMADTKVEW